MSKVRPLSFHYFIVGNTMHYEPLSNTNKSQENVEGNRLGKIGALQKGRARTHEQPCDYNLVIWKSYKGKTVFPGACNVCLRVPGTISLSK